MAGLGLGLGISSATSGNTSGIIPPVPGIAGLLITQDGKNLITQSDDFIAATEPQAGE
tara:strand:- start:651 stop:824 length:174 start_codon:yes stop_codon:yes gene_type:complete